MKVRQVISETPASFLAHLKEYTFIEKKPLRFCAERLTSLVRTLELTNIEDYQPLQEVATFATLVATYEKGFLLILEPYESETADSLTQFYISLAWTLQLLSSRYSTASAQSSSHLGQFPP